MHFNWHKAVGAVAVGVLCILDAAQSTPIAPKRSLDSTELYYLAHDSDDATSSYKPLEKKAKTSSDVAGARPQQAHRPLLDLNKVPSSHSLDKTELSSGARLPLEDGATSAHKHPEKEARPSSSAGGSNGQQVGSPSSNSVSSTPPTEEGHRVGSPSRNSVSSTPPSSRHSSPHAYESHSWNEKQSEVSTSDASWQVQTPRRPKPSKALKGTRRVGKASSSLNAGPATHMNALRTEDFDNRGRGSLTAAPGKLWHEPPELMDVYSTKGVIKAKALAIQQHVPEYPTVPSEYDFKPSRLEVKNGHHLSQRQATGHNQHVRKTYARMAKNQEKGLPLLKGVPLMLAKDHSMDASLEARQRRPALPPGAPLQDYRTLLSDDGKLKQGAVASRRRRQREARKQLNFESGRKRAAVHLKGVTDARVFEKAVKVREHYGSHALRPEYYKYEPTLPMDRTSKEFKVKQRENWILVTNRRFKKLGMRLDDTRGESSSSDAKPKRSHRRRGGL